MNHDANGIKQTQTGGRPATSGLIRGRYSLSVGMPSETPPDGWSWLPLSELARLETGHTPSRKHHDYWDGDFCWIGIKDATSNHGRTLTDTFQHITRLGLENSSARLLPKNTVCLSRTASVGYVVVMGKEMATSQDFVNWVCSENLDHDFLKYILLSERDSFLRFASGTTHQTIYFPEAKAFHVCIPPIGEQKAIAHILATLDDKIELNRKTNETLEAMAKALFQSWFVDFDPVRAKAEGRSTGLPDEIRELFPDSFEDSELGEIPRGWEICGLERFLVLQRGYDLPATQRINGKYPVIAASGPSGCHNEAMSTAPGVVTGRSGVLGKVFYVQSDFFPLNTTLWAKEFRLATPIYAYFLLGSIDFSSFNAGSAVPTLNRNHLGGLRFAAPPSEIIRFYSETAVSLMTGVEQISNQVACLVETRDTLLPKLISGELRIPEAEKLVSDLG